MDLASAIVLASSVASLATLILAFLFRKRLLAALGRLLFGGAIEFARATFLEEGIQVGEDGQKRPYVRLRPRGEALLGALVPVLIASAVKGMKLKPGALGASPLPAGLDLSNLAESLPALLGSGLIPKKYAGILALAAPFLQGFMKGGAGKKAGETANPFIKELGP